MRVLAVIRQSKRKEASESPESQRRDIHAWCQREGHTIIGEASDIGVSASVSPFKRASLGPWLNEPEKLAQWDILAGWKLDRLVRDTKHFYGDLFPRLQQLNKNTVAVTENVDTSKSSAPELAFRVSMAQEELQKIKDRARSSRQGLRGKARWGGGIPPFGYYSVKTETGYKLAIDEQAMRAIYSVVDLLKNNYTINYCIRWLTQEGVKTAWDRHAKRQGKKPKNRAWRWRTLDAILRSRHLLGEATYQGDVIRDEEGNPRKFGEPLMERSEWDELQGLLSQKRRPYRRRRGSMMRHVAYCAYCGSPMHHYPTTTSDPIRRYFCGSRGSSRERVCYEISFPAAELEEIVSSIFLEEYGDKEIIEVEATAVIDHSSRLREIDEALDQLETDHYVKGRFKGEEGEKRFDRLYSRLETEREELNAASEDQGIRRIHTGKTYREKWEESSSDEQGQLLRYYGVTAMVQEQRMDSKIPLSVGRSVSVEMPETDPSEASIIIKNNKAYDAKTGEEITYEAEEATQKTKENR